MKNPSENLIPKEQAEIISESDASRINNLGNISNDIEELNHYLENPDALPSVDEKYIDDVRQRRDTLKQDENSLYSFSIGKIKNIPNSKVILDLVQSADVSIMDKYDKQTNKLLQNNVSATLMTAEEKQQYYDAQSRRDGFVTYLRDNFGINQEVGKKLYGEIARRQEIKLSSNNKRVGIESDGLRMQKEDQKRIDEEKIGEIRNRLNLPNEENKSEKLYRAYTLNPEDLSIEKFQELLVPMNINEKDPTKVNDGNELGVYMSTNEDMVKAAYSHSGDNIPSLRIKTPRYNNDYGIVSDIKLPSCGVIIEIDTKNLSIREPEITQALQGHYNNEFGGREWIADGIPPSNYKVKKLILNIGSSGLDKIEIEVDGSDKQKLKEAIEFIKNKFNQKKQEATLYKKFLESISERERMSNKFYLESKWKKYKEENSETEEEITKNETQSYVEENLRDFENVEVKKMSELPCWGKINKFFGDKGIAESEVIIIGDEEKWKSIYGSNDSKSSHKPKAIILKKEIFDQENISDENMSWLIHEIGHIEFYKGLGEKLDEYMEEYHKKGEYTDSEMEKSAFKLQFEFLKSIGKTKEECLDFIKKYLNKSFNEDEKEEKEKELTQIEKYLNSTY